MHFRDHFIHCLINLAWLGDSFKTIYHDMIILNQYLLLMKVLIKAVLPVKVAIN